MKFFDWRSKRKAANVERKARFLELIQLAHDIAAIDPGGLRSLVRLTAATLQARTIMAVAHSAPHKARGSDNLGTLLFDQSLPLTSDGRSASDLVLRTSGQRYRIRLGDDPVLANPWNRGRIANALATIGFGKRQGAWIQDSNHRVTLVLPFGVGLVSGGNHSIAAGIIDGEGCVTSINAEDVTPIYEHVRYDGHSFVRIFDGAALSQPQDEEPGILYEIGRLMVEHGVSPSAGCIDPQAEPSPLLSGSEFYYEVLLNGRDSGAALTSSGAALALRQAGLLEDSAQWHRVLNGEEPFTRTNYNGKQETVALRWRFPWQIYNDLTFIHSINTYPAIGA